MRKTKLTIEEKIEIVRMYSEGKESKEHVKSFL